MRRPSLNGSKTLPDHGFLDSVRLLAGARVGIRKYEADKDALMRQGKIGDIGALCLLKERFGLRLPAVEGRLLFTLPWMK